MTGTEWTGAAAVPAVIDLDDLDRSRIAAVGGKAANLGELLRVDGVRVPPGFCVTTAAFREAVESSPATRDLLDDLARLGDGTSNGDALRTTTARLRRTLEATGPPPAVATAIRAALARHGRDVAYAVRSSATAEDLPTASFAGQHDSYLGVVGSGAVLAHVTRCWASLFTDRAVAYRVDRGVDHRAVLMAVVVQRMVPASAAGVLFTADPVTGNRRDTTIEAVAGLGEALVAGTTAADSYRIRDDAVTAAAPVRPDRPVFTAPQAVELARLGRRVEAHFGRPQDIEWCLSDDGFALVQSRPVTTLFPIPAATDDETHVYLSVGHQQMMTDAFRPLGLSLWHLTTSAVMAEAGSRLFVDITRRLGTPGGRAAMLAVTAADPLTHDALRTVVDRVGFVRELPDDPARPPWLGGAATTTDPDPAVVAEVIADNEASLAALERTVASLSGPALFDFLPTAFEEDKRLLFDPRSIPLIMAGMDASAWLNEHLADWLGETNVADTLTLSAPHNVTSEMGLALLDVADVVRPFPAVVAFLERTVHESNGDDDLLDALEALSGGPEARAALEAYLHRYGMRGAGEIDVTRPRWREQPEALVPALLADIRGFAPGEAVRRFEHGRELAERKAADVVTRVRDLPDGEQRAAEVERMIARVRTFTGYREYPKYNRVSRSFVYRQALLREAERLLQTGVLRRRDDIDFLRFEELREVVNTGVVDHDLVATRRAEFVAHQPLTPPRVLTSEGEALNGAYRTGGLPPGALAGLAVSAGTVEGPARIVLDLARADLAPGDILVTTFTDPSWTPLFVAVSGLVTEVGGLMTHGAVIAREYGLPAVVGVEGATRKIRDGQRIRVHGTAGYVEIVD